MPELPEVETVRRGLAPAMEGGTLDRLTLNRPDLRFAFTPGLQDDLQGRRILSVGRRAKYLMIDFDGDQVLVCHLGMSGSFRVETAGTQTTPGDFHHPRGVLAAHDHVLLDIGHDDGRRFRVTYNDARRFGFMFHGPRATIFDNPHLSGLGVEPTGNSLDAVDLARRFAGRAAPLKSALLDQSVIAGLGNIYVCEALWRARLSPRRKTATLVRADGQPTRRLHDLVDAIRAVIAQAIEAGGSTLRDHRLADGSLGYFQHSFAVYGREGEPCKRPACRGTVARFVQSGRSTFACASCQR